MNDRIELEDEIMKIDNITDLFETVLNDITFYDDKSANLLLGVKELYKLRYEKLWDTFKRVYKLDEYRDSID